MTVSQSTLDRIGNCRKVKILKSRILNSKQREQRGEERKGKERRENRRVFSSSSSVAHVRHARPAFCPLFLIALRSSLAKVLL